MTFGRTAAAGESPPDPAARRLDVQGLAASPSSWIDTSRRRALTAEERAIAGSTATVGIDFVDEICDERRCSTARGRRIMYRNQDHLSVEGR